MFTSVTPWSGRRNRGEGRLGPREDAGASS